MKAEELAKELLTGLAVSDGGVKATEWVCHYLRSYGLACAMAEREANVEVAETTYAKTAFHYELGTAVAQNIRSRPVGDALMKEIEG